MIINIAHQKGGVGKSTLATNLAVAMKGDILDLDSQHSCLLFSRLREDSGLGKIAVHTADTVDELKEIVGSYNGEKTLIIDSGGYDNEINRTSLYLSDIILTPVGPAQIEIFGLKKFSSILENVTTKLQQSSGRSDISLRSNVIINNADPRSQGAIGELKEYIVANSKWFDLLESVLHARTDYKRAYGQGKSVEELKAGSKAGEELQSLVKDIKSVIAF
ncbi:MAG: ParA family protein [Nitrospirae bacterium]|nr:ParA family protein [Nitrospirota bacterium]